ncbi:MAG: hypothetical protein ABI586_01375 [Candidatus Nanopelagicales bacterium]
MEHRKSFQLVIGLVAFALATVLGFSLFRLLPQNSVLASLALLLLCAGAVTGFDRLFTLLLPPVLSRLFPRLDAEVS